MQASAVLGRVADLREVDDRGRAHVDEAERGDQHAGIDVSRGVGRRPLVLDVAVVVGIDQAVGERGTQQAPDRNGCGCRQSPGSGSGLRRRRRPHRRHRYSGRTSRIFPSSISTSPAAKSPTLGSTRQNDAALEQDALGLLQPRKLGVGSARAPQSAPAARSRQPAASPAPSLQNGRVRVRALAQSSRMCDPPHTISGSSRSSRPKPSRGARTVSRFMISQAGAMLACTTGTCRSCSSNSTMLSVCQAPPWM